MLLTYTLLLLEPANALSSGKSCKSLERQDSGGSDMHDPSSPASCSRWGVARLWLRHNIQGGRLRTREPLRVAHSGTQIDLLGLLDALRTHLDRVGAVVQHRSPIVDVEVGSEALPVERVRLGYRMKSGFRVGAGDRQLGRSRAWLRHPQWIHTRTLACACATSSRASRSAEAAQPKRSSNSAAVKPPWTMPGWPFSSLPTSTIMVRRERPGSTGGLPAARAVTGGPLAVVAASVPCSVHCHAATCLIRFSPS